MDLLASTCSRSRGALEQGGHGWGDDPGRPGGASAERLGFDGKRGRSGAGPPLAWGRGSRGLIHGADSHRHSETPVDRADLEPLEVLLPVGGGVRPAAGGDGGAAEAKSEFDIELTGVGEKKINVIKVIREITALGLKEAKDLADGAPSVIKEAVAADEANEMKTKLEEAGATVTLK
mgnify:CR=1 FL=1